VSQVPVSRTVSSSPPLHLVSDPPRRPPIRAPRWLGDVALGLAEARDLWAPKVHHDPSRRFSVRIAHTEEYDAWLIGWVPGQGISAHDHGNSAGAVVVTDGTLVEARWPAGSSVPEVRQLAAGEPPVVLDADQVHALANLHDAVATSVHVYSPPLTEMRWFEAEEDRLRLRREEPVRADGSHQRTVDALLRDARARFRRLLPVEARLAAADGALLVDIRPEANRRAEGSLPGAVVVERNELEWRLDPTSPDRLPEILDHDARIVLVCNEGYASSLAAGTLHDLGLMHATDLEGGFRAWKDAGLPVAGL